MSLIMKLGKLAYASSEKEEANTIVRPMDFALLLAGLTICGLVIRFYHIEDGLNLFGLFLVVILGFALHALMPMRYRLPFLFLLNIVAMLALFGAVAGAGIVGFGLLLYFIANLSIAVNYRILLCLIPGGILVLGKLQKIPFPEMNTIATVVGGLFMFRTMVYLYEMQFDKSKEGIWKRLNYFFLLPNLIFTIFPVVDFKTFIRSYYNTPAAGNYYKGLLWIMRGLLHLFLYRLIYYYLIPAPGDINSVFDVLQYMVMSYALIIRLSGIFHLSTGIICLFGFNLPPTFDNYFLANGFSDLWRRINIYWKDFMMKVFYFPLYFKFKKRNNTAMFFTIMIVFLINWLLHQYQWFWIRGNFPIRAIDLIFWLLFGVLVACNSIYQKSQKKKRKTTAGFSVKEALRESFKIIGMLAFMSVLWSFWTSPTFETWLQLLKPASTISLSQFGVLVLGLLGCCGVGVLGFYLEYNWKKEKKSWSDRTLLKVYSAGLLVFMVLGSPSISQKVGTQLSMDVGPILETRLNKFDEQQLFQGYYESLLVGNNFSSRMWEVEEEKKKQRKDERELLGDTEIVEMEETLAEKRLKPSWSIPFKGTQLSTNEHGMRDRSYSLDKGAGTLRMALLGGSSEMGSGVADGLTFDNLLEDHFTKNKSWKGFQKTEILNFAISGIHLPQQVGITEMRLTPFKPDVFIYCVHDKESSRSLNSFARIIQKEYVQDYPRLAEIAKQAGVAEDTDPADVFRLIKPFEEELVIWGLDRMQRYCETNDLIPVCLFMSTLGGGKKSSKMTKEQFLDLFRARGFHLLDLARAFDGHDKETLKVSRWDRHPNAKAHQLIKDALIEAFEVHTELKSTIEEKGK